jgi:TP901 family phage tail tape measure protein
MAESLLPPVVVTLLADIKQFSAEVGKAKGEMDTLEAKGASTGSILSKGLGMAALGVGGLAAGIAGIGIKSAMDYESAMAQVAGQLGLTKQQQQSLADTFMKTSKGSEFSATELANAYATVAGQVKNLSGGSDTAQASTEVLRSSMALAVAKGIDLNSAIGSVVGTMRTFQMPTSQASDAMTVLYNASSATGLSVDALGSTLARMNGAVAGVKPPASDLAALLQDLGQHGVTGSRAISSATQAITKMLNPTFQAKAATAGLNLTTYDANGTFVGFRNIIEQLQPQLAGMTQQQQQATLASLGLGSAGEKLLPTINAGAAAFDQAKKAVQDHKKATDAAARASDTFHGNLKKVESAASNAAVQIGNILMPFATKALQWIGTKGADDLTKFINGLTGKGHSTNWAHQAGQNFRDFGNGVKNAFDNIKAGWDIIPAPLRPLVIGAAVGGIAGSKFGPEGTLIGAGIGTATAGTRLKAAPSAPWYEKLGMNVISGISKETLGLSGGPFWSLFSGGKAGAAELKPTGRGAAAGGASPALQQAMNSSLVAIATNTAGAANTLQTSDGRLERHGEYLEKIDTYSVFISQHTRESNSHLIAIAKGVNKTDKVNIKVRLV